MSATRVLVLWMVRGYGRAHGYVIGTELLSWGAGEWANVKWGIRAPRPRADYLGAAMAMLPALPRAEAIALLHERLAALEV